MSEKPILFSTPMVRALIAGNKTQTRRVIKLRGFSENAIIKKTKHGFLLSEGGSFNIPMKARYQPGDILWVREAWRLGDFSFIDDDVSASVQYKDLTTGPRLHYLKHGMDERLGWRPSIHMPRAAARIFLLVTDVRAERLQEILEKDARAEGAHNGLEFLRIWDKINKKRGHGWDVNPWVWVYTFERTEAAR